MPESPSAFCLYQLDSVGTRSSESISAQERSFALTSSNHIIIGDARVAIRWTTVLCSSYILTLQQPTEQQQIENWVLPITPHLSLEFHIVLTCVRQLLLTKEFLRSLDTWSTQRSPHLVEVYHRSSLSANPVERAMKPKCAVAASPVVLDMKLNLWYG
jgi:hypothetical protein